MVLLHLHGLLCSVIIITIIIIIPQLVHPASTRVSPPRWQHMLIAQLWHIMRSTMACQWIYMYLKVFHIIGEFVKTLFQLHPHKRTRSHWVRKACTQTTTDVNWLVVACAVHNSKDSHTDSKTNVDQCLLWFRSRHFYYYILCPCVAFGSVSCCCCDFSVSFSLSASWQSTWQHVVRPFKRYKYVFHMQKLLLMKYDA